MADAYSLLSTLRQHRVPLLQVTLLGGIALHNRCLCCAQAGLALHLPIQHYVLPEITH